MSIYLRWLQVKGKRELATNLLPTFSHQSSFWKSVIRLPLPMLMLKLYSLGHFFSGVIDYIDITIPTLTLKLRHF